MFIQTEPTPNPDSLKFLPGKQVLESGARDFRSFRDAQASPLAKKIFQMDGVTGVFLSTDFVTVCMSARPKDARLSATQTDGTCSLASCGAPPETRVTSHAAGL